MATKKSHTYKDITLDFVPNPVTGFGTKSSVISL